MEFDALDIEPTAVTEDGETARTGDAICLLVGNARRFVAEGGQGDTADDVFDVAVVERMPAPNVVAEAIGQRPLGRDTPGVTHLLASELHVTAPDPTRFSRDGELAEHDGLDRSVHAAAFDVRVGEDYDPDPVPAARDRAKRDGCAPERSASRDARRVRRGVRCPRRWPRGHPRK